METEFEFLDKIVKQISVSYEDNFVFIYELDGKQFDSIHLLCEYINPDLVKPRKRK